MTSKARLAPIREILDQQDLDAVAFVPGANFYRIFGRNFHLMERPLIIIVPRGSEAVAIVPNLEMASFSALDFDGAVFDWRDEDGFSSAFDAAANALPHLGSARAFGLEGQRMRAFEHMELQRVFPGATFCDAHQALSAIRLRKSAEEIDRIAKAVAISEVALEATLEAVKVGMTETEIQSVLVRELFSHGAEGLAFEPIVAAGSNSAQPHASARSDYQVAAGDALLFDFGAAWGGYNADITRTVFIQSVSDRDRAFYETVRLANEAGRMTGGAGVTASAVDAATKEVLLTSDFAEFYRHKTGHGLGIDVHEAPNIMDGDDTVLEPGMVFTIEPGLYRLGECGVRIEDDMVVEESGLRSLTSSPRQLRLVG